MKKFITFIPMQPKGKLLSGVYKSDINKRLQTDFEIHFPVTAMINGYVEPGENIVIIALAEKGNPECDYNLNLLKQEITTVAVQIGFGFEICKVEISKEEKASAHLKTFSNLINKFNDGDMVYACITFGTKPTPIVEMMALNFCYKTKMNVSVECVCYGKVNRSDNPVSYCIYDITSLFFMNEIVDTLAERNEPNPENVIARILNIKPEPGRKD